MFSQPNFKGFDIVCIGRHNQSSLHFFLTSSDKTFYDQNALTSGYRQDKKTKMATRSMVVMTIKPGTFTTISPPTFSQLKNHPGYAGTAECGHDPEQPCTHPMQVFGYNF